MRTPSDTGGRPAGNPGAPRSGIAVVGTASLYVVTAWLGMRLAIPPGNVTPVFYASGVALGGALLFGPRALIGVALGSFLGNAFLFPATSGPSAFVMAVLIGLGAALQAATGRSLVRRFASSDVPFSTTRDVLVFVAGGALLACTVNATVGILTLRGFGVIGDAAVVRTWFTWWTGDAVGVLTAAPLVMAGVRPAPEMKGRRGEATILFALTILAGAVVTTTGYPLVYLLIPSVVWAGVRLGLRATISMVVVIALVGVAAALNRTGPFRHFDLAETVLLLQALVAVCALTGLVLAVQSARERAGEEQRREAHARLATHAEELEGLYGELQRRVSDRSRELALTLAPISAPKRPLEPRFAPGTVLHDRARIRHFLGRGGMGAVYLADDLVLNRPVAAKIIASRKADPSALFRFFNEARAASAIDHPAIVRTLSVDVTDDGLLYQLLDYIDGESLAARARRDPRLSPGEIARMGAVVAGALAAAHAAGIVHRDVKPSNVMLTAAPPGVRVLDFGISKLLAEDSDAPWSTQTGVGVGTPAYVAPEQFADASRAGPPADVYSLGASLFELLTTVAPAGANRARRMKDAAVPEGLATVILAAMAEEAGARPQAASFGGSLAAIADDLGAPAAEEIARRSPPPSQVTRRSDEGAG
jgi:serine/threonine-protein kinase